MFKDKKLLITGGTGSFGHAILNGLLKTELSEIRILSRDEKKQDDMRHEYNCDKLQFYIGDVRDISSVRTAMQGVDYVFHAAALKQVPPYEYFPMEVVKTNILGTENVLTAAILEGVKKIVCLSTDKAVEPINAMGISKAMMEKLFVAKSRTTTNTIICGTRYGNVLCSRGSVVPLFIDQIIEKKPLTVTAPLMTRFIMSLEEAVDLVIYAFKNGKSGDIYVQKAPACSIEILAQAVKEIFSASNPVNIIGIRHGEKMHETLLTKAEAGRALDLNQYYCVPADNRDLNYDKFIVKGNVKEIEVGAFTSESTHQLDVNQVKDKLLSLPYVQGRLNEFKMHN